MSQNNLPDWDARKMAASQLFNFGTDTFAGLQRMLGSTMAPREFDRLCHELEALVATRWAEAAEGQEPET